MWEDAPETSGFSLRLCSSLRQLIGKRHRQLILLSLLVLLEKENPCTATMELKYVLSVLAIAVAIDASPKSTDLDSLLACNRNACHKCVSRCPLFCLDPREGPVCKSQCRKYSRFTLLWGMWHILILLAGHNCFDMHGCKLC